MNRVVVFDIGTTRLKVAIFSKGRPETYQEYRLDMANGKIDPKPIVKIIKTYSRTFKSFIITGQRASIIGWNGEDSYSPIYTWKSTEAESLRERYVDPDDEILNLFVRPGSGALRIKYVQDMGFRYVGGVESFITWILTGHHVVDHAYAHTFGVYDPFNSTYLDYIIEKLEIDVSRLPRIIDSCKEDVSGYREVLAMIPDQSASLISEIVDDAEAKVTLGTGAFLDLYTDRELVGDPLRGINPMISYLADDGPRYMAEAFIFEWGSSLDYFLKVNGLKYGDLDRVMLEDTDYKPYPPLLRSTLNPVEVKVDGGSSIKDLVLTLSSSISYMILSMKELKDFDKIHVNGGGAKSEIILYLIANSSGVDILVRGEPEKASIYGAYAYYLMRYGGDYRAYLDECRPIVKRIVGSERYREIVDIYSKYLETSQ